MEFLSAYKAAFEDYLQDHPFHKEPVSLYDPIDYILDLGGKRVRPVLLLLAHDCFGGGMNDAMAAALAVEVFHNFTLVHDDIMDDAPLRRGKQTVHEKYDVNTGILSGDVMLIKSYEFLSTYPDEISIKLIRTFNEMSVHLCEGQQMDMDFETSTDVSIPAYMKMIEYKTSVLIAAALKMGAIIAGASESDANHLYHYGLNVGIAFQMQDDILDTFGEAKVGKQEGGDIIQNKKTYLYLKCLELGSDAEKEELHKWYLDKPEDPTEKIAAVRNIFKNNHVVTYADEVKSEYKNLALSHLDMVSFEEEKKLIFRKIADYLLSREI